MKHISPRRQRCHRVLCRFVAKRLLREATQPRSNVAAFLEDASAHREAAALAAKFNLRCIEQEVSTRLHYGPVYIVQIPCMVRVHVIIFFSSPLFCARISQDVSLSSHVPALFWGNQCHSRFDACALSCSEGFGRNPGLIPDSLDPSTSFFSRWVR